MSATNWNICPMCVKRAKDMKTAFENKYYGKLDSYVYGKIIAEIDNAVEYMESYSDTKHKPNPEILKLMDEKKIKVEVYGNTYEYYEILFDGQSSCCLREDYESGVDDDGNMNIYYGCSCDCGFEKDMNFNESKHKIMEK